MHPGGIRPNPRLLMLLLRRVSRVAPSVSQPEPFFQTGRPGTAALAAAAGSLSPRRNSGTLSVGSGSSSALHHRDGAALDKSSPSPLLTKRCLRGTPITSTTSTTWAPLPSPLYLQQHRSTDMFLFRKFFSTSSPQTMAAAQQKAQDLIDNNAVVVFSKSYCPYCSKTKGLLNSLDVKYELLELDQLGVYLIGLAGFNEDGSEIQAALEKISGQRTVPNVFIGKEHIGGNSDVQALNSSGQLEKKLQAVSVL